MADPREIDLYWHKITDTVDELVACLGELDGESLDWKPLDDANSLYVLATHTMGNVRHNLLKRPLRLPITRDRDAEFVARGGSATEIEARWNELKVRISDAIEELPPTELDRERGRPKPWDHHRPRAAPLRRPPRRRALRPGPAHPRPPEGQTFRLTMAERSSRRYAPKRSPPRQPSWRGHSRSRLASGSWSRVRHSGRRSCAGSLKLSSAPACSQEGSFTSSAARPCVRAGPCYLGPSQTGQAQPTDSCPVWPLGSSLRLGISAYRRKRSLGRLLSSLDAPQPCWYLNAIGVEPSQQGTGLGTALLDFMLRRVDEDALPSFLDTSLPDNLGYYERFGFRVTAESTLPNGIPLWGMTRQPRPIHGAGGKH